MPRLTTKPKGLYLGKVVIAVAFSLNAVSCLPASNIASYKSQEICETAACRQTANSILEKMDESVNPCDDFYQFACGNFAENAVIPHDKSSTGLFATTRDKVTEQLKESIESDLIESDPKSFEMLKTYYQICMNEEHVDKTSDGEFLEILQNLGGWPVLVGKSWDASNFDWKQIVYKLFKIGYAPNYIVDFEISADMKHNNKKVIYLDRPSFGIAREYLSQGLDESIVKAYYKYMVDFATLFGADRDEATKDLKESLDFEIELAKISLPSSQRRNVTKSYNPTTVGELQADYPDLPWLEYINNILSPYQRIDDNELIIVSEPSYFKKLFNILAKTPKRVLANYVFWRVARETSSNLSERARKLQREFSASITGHNVKSPRWKVCVSHVNSRIYLAVSSLYVRRYFNKETKDVALEMIQNVRASYRQALLEIDWMDENTRKEALEKLDKMVPLVAYPDELLDNDKLDDYYKDFKVYPNSFLKTELSLGRFSLARIFKDFRKPVVKSDWTGLYGSAATVNAFYSPMKNTIQFPAGILQEGFFNAENPKYVNYASLGSIMGHEMTHGFDDSGRRFDKNGNLIDWWNPETKKEYLRRAQCIINQYSNFTVKQVGLKVNGVLTQGENIADNGGIKEAYLAYENWEKENGIEPRLRGLEKYTPRQTFWLANANVWCSKYRPEYLKNLMVTDPHTPHDFRVIGPISNRPEFSKDFNCPLGSTMNPVHKCTVW